MKYRRRWHRLPTNSFREERNVKFELCERRDFGEPAGVEPWQCEAGTAQLTDGKTNQFVLFMTAPDGSVRCVTVELDEGEVCVQIYPDDGVSKFWAGEMRLKPAHEEATFRVPVDRFGSS